MNTAVMKHTLLLPFVAVNEPARNAAHTTKNASTPTHAIIVGNRSRTDSQQKGLLSINLRRRFCVARLPRRSQRSQRVMRRSEASCSAFQTRGTHRPARNNASPPVAVWAISAFQNGHAPVVPL